MAVVAEVLRYSWIYRLGKVAVKRLMFVRSGFIHPCFPRPEPSRELYLSKMCFDARQLISTYYTTAILDRTGGQELFEQFECYDCEIGGLSASNIKTGCSCRRAVARYCDSCSYINTFVLLTLNPGMTVIGHVQRLDG